MVSVWGLTDRGIVRRENQDSCAYEIIEDGDLAWGVVCDGMGGAKAGDIASKMAVETFCAHLEQLRDLEGPPPAADLLLAAAEDANRVVYLKAETDRDCVGMGTTLVGRILAGHHPVGGERGGQPGLSHHQAGHPGGLPGTTLWWRIWWPRGT